jgi:hypothetical protein
LLIDPRLKTPWAGTGVPIGNNTIATCLHVFPPPATSMWIDGQTVPIEMWYSGGLWREVNADGTVARSDDWVDVSKDWQEFHALAGNFEPAPGSEIDFDRPLRVGETIYLIGFGGDATKIDRESARSMKPTVVAGRVAETPPDWKDRIIAVEVSVPPEHKRFGGMSGGAAVVFDETSGNWVVVGLSRGLLETRNRLGPFEWSVGSVVQVVRPPSRPGTKASN